MAVSGYCPFHYVPCSVTYAFHSKTRLINEEQRTVLLAHPHAFAYHSFSNTGNYSQTEVEASSQKTFYKLENELQNPCKLQGTLGQIVGLRPNHSLILLDQFQFFNIITSVLSHKNLVKLNTDLQIFKTGCHTAGQEGK